MVIGYQEITPNICAMDTQRPRAPNTRRYTLSIRNQQFRRYPLPHPLQVYSLNKGVISKNQSRSRLPVIAEFFCFAKIDDYDCKSVITIL